MATTFPTCMVQNSIELRGGQAALHLMPARVFKRATGGAMFQGATRQVGSRRHAPGRGARCSPHNSGPLCVPCLVLWAGFKLAKARGARLGGAARRTPEAGPCRARASTIGKGGLARPCRALPGPAHLAQIGQDNSALDSPGGAGCRRQDEV